MAGPVVYGAPSAAGKTRHTKSNKKYIYSLPKLEEKHFKAKRPNRSLVVYAAIDHVLRHDIQFKSNGQRVDLALGGGTGSPSVVAGLAPESR